VERELAELERGGPLESTENFEPGELGSEELYEDEFDEGLAEDLRERLAAIERAQARVREGTYGTSVESGVRIPDERLEAAPWAELTLEEEQSTP